MRLRAGLQREVEQMSERIGLPTRSEMDAAHRRIAELERSCAACRRRWQCWPEPLRSIRLRSRRRQKVKPAARKAANKTAPATKAPAKRRLRKS